MRSFRATLAANQQEFRAALAANLAAAGQPDADDRAGAIITVCDGLIVHFLLYGEARRPKDIAREAAAASRSSTSRAPLDDPQAVADPAPYRDGRAHDRPCLPLRKRLNTRAGRESSRSSSPRPRRVRARFSPNRDPKAVTLPASP